MPILSRDGSGVGVGGIGEGAPARQLQPACYAQMVTLKRQKLKEEKWPKLINISYSYLVEPMNLQIFANGGQVGSIKNELN